MKYILEYLGCLEIFSLVFIVHKFVNTKNKVINVFLICPSCFFRELVKGPVGYSQSVDMINLGPPNTYPSRGGEEDFNPDL